MKLRDKIWILAPVCLAVFVLSACSKQGSTQPKTTELEVQEYIEETVKHKESMETIEPFSEAETQTAPETETEPESEIEPEEWEPFNLMIATDIHYLARELMDRGSRFQEMVEFGDGKVVTYIEEITDAFLDEVISLRPGALILSGDLTLNGEKASHEELAKKLYRVEAAGIPVAVIPGNHDLNNHQAARYEGEQRLPAEFTTPGEFREIYRDFGYDEAMDEDRTTLSYIYPLRDDIWLLMLDSCQYDPVSKVGGSILTSTYDWLEGWLETAWDEGIRVIPVAHHNLLDQSEIYVDDCTIEHSSQLIDILENWDIPLFLSGHLHVQHFKRSHENRGIWEIVTSSLATPACQYGSLVITSDGFDYKTWSVDIETWAASGGSTEPELLNFNKFKGPFLKQVFYRQAIKSLENVGEVGEEQRQKMARLYSELKYQYYQGTAYLIKDIVVTDPGYQLWLEEGAPTELSAYVEYIVQDAAGDFNRLAK